MSTSGQKDEPEGRGSHGRRGEDRRWSNRTSVGVIAITAAIGLAAVVSSILGALGGQHSAPSSALKPPAASEHARSLPAAPGSDYVIDLKTGVMTRLPESIIRSVAPGGRGFPRYAASPDGSRLAYVGPDHEMNRQVFIAGIDGSGVRQATRDAIGAQSPAWSPDATKIAYVGYRSPGVRHLFVLDVATGESAPIAGAGRVGSWAQPRFTPDGSALLYGQGRALRTVPIDGGESTVLLGPHDGLEVGNGALSPDGSLVTMMGNEVDGPGAIRFVAHVDGTARRAFAVGGSNPAGTWSPDGRRLVCSDQSRSLVVVVDVAARSIRHVARGSSAIWLDRHRLLVEQ
jgi:Tol biopolymer transport system component